LPAQPAAAVLARTPQPARRPGCGATGDPRLAGSTQGALVAGRGSGRSLLSGPDCRLRLLSHRRLPGGGASRLLPHQHGLLVTPHLEHAGCLDQVTELAIAVVARVERGLVANLLADRAQS